MSLLWDVLKLVGCIFLGCCAISTAALVYMIYVAPNIEEWDE